MDCIKKQAAIGRLYNETVEFMLYWQSKERGKPLSLLLNSPGEACGNCLKFLPHDFLHPGKLRLSGAVAGVVQGGIDHEFSGGMTHLLSIGIHFHEMETADENIRPEPFHDV